MGHLFQNLAGNCMDVKKFKHEKNYTNILSENHFWGDIKVTDFDNYMPDLWNNKWFFLIHE